jgi:hypothetical protein
MPTTLTKDARQVLNTLKQDRLGPARRIGQIKSNGGPVLEIAQNTKTPDQPPATVGGCSRLHQEGKRPRLDWKVELGAAPNYRKLGGRLAASGDLYRHHDGHALLQVLADGKTRLISKGAQLAPLIVDRLKMIVTKENKIVSELPTAAHLNAMLRSEKFLGQFQSVDEVASHPLYLDDFTLAQPGYNNAGAGQRVLYVGPQPTAAASTEAIEKFLKVMAFASNADRTNTVAAALTVLLRRKWLGQKPVILVTSTKSHSGKGTITEFFRGSVPKADLLYEAIDWPMQSQFQQQVQANPEIGVVVFDNVRCDSAGRSTFIRSAFIESFVTNHDLTLASPSAGDPLHLDNRFVVTINTNDGRLSPDLLNRALPIHLAPRGNVHEHETPIGNPKLEFLPTHRDQIEAELRGMIERWKEAGRPLDEDVRHSMALWARTIGGILRVSGFTDFLGNSGERRSTDDPVQEALAILGVAKPGKALRPGEWAKIIVDEGLVKTLLPPNERDTEKAQTRATGVVLKKNLEATFLGQTDVKVYQLRLEGGLRRWVKGKNPHVRYVFTVLKEESLPEECGREEVAMTPKIGNPLKLPVRVSRRRSHS